MTGRAKDVFRRITEDKAILSALFAALGSALVAGTLPEFLKLIPGGKWTLAAVMTAGFIILAKGWLNLNSRVGVGVAVFLQPTSTSGWSDAALIERAATTRSRHVSFFYVNVDELYPSMPNIGRAGLAQRVIEARLKEEKSNSRYISFYLTCSLGNAFSLGQQLFGAGQSSPLRIFEFKEISVHQVSSPGSSAPLPPLALQGTPNGPQVRSSTYRLDSAMRQEVSILQLAGSISSRPNRHALIVNVSNNSNMVAEAKEAARGVGGTRYSVGSTDACVSALVYESILPQFPNDRSAYNQLLNEIVAQWRLYLSTQAAAQGSPAEGRLFISAPTSLAFSLGALLSASTTAVDYV